MGAWPAAAGADSGPSPAPGAPQGGSAGEVLVRAPLLHGVVERLRERGERVALLELGPALPGNLELFGELRCRLTVADARRELTAVASVADADPGDWAGLMRGLIPEPGPEPWGLVMLWDLVNYLPPALLTALMARIAPGLETGSLVHALVESSRQWIPPEPGRYAHAEGDRFRRVGPLEPPVRSPRYSHWDLMQCWPGFQSQKSMLLKSGAQEYLFRYG